MPAPNASDPTPESAAPTDVAPLGRAGARPPHELTAAEERNATDWDAVAADAGFTHLLASKARFIIPATLFFVIYYFTLPILVGWFPRFMERKVVGEVNLAYLFALSQFFMAWIVAFLYVGAAAGWDRQAARLVAKFAKR
ncbi:MAG TPA: DUF485 domain-containing protein [Terrimicrobiaceae bacterium]